MLKTIKGTYSNGTIELLEMPTEIQSQTDVLVTFFVQEIFDRDNALAESLHDPKWAVTTELSTLLRGTQKSFPLKNEYMVYFEQFVQIVNEKLLTLYEHASHNHLRLVILLKTALRRLETVNLTYKHLTLFEQLLSSLTNQVVTSDEIIDLQKQLRSAGIETLMCLERQYDELVELYEKDNEQPPQRSVGEAFKELRQLCLEEEYTLEIPPRQNRPNAFVEMLDEWN